jgi:outer membrane protein OmpA-like peptidoglycan-associated protein/Tfp pilus assembly protein PilF/Tol biopolymer transport system component
MNRNITNKIRAFLILFFLLGGIAQTHAQWYDPEKINKKAKAIYESAYDYATHGDYLKSIEAIGEAIKLEPKYVEAYLSRAGIFADLKNYQASADDFKKAFELDSIFSDTYAISYSISLAGIGNFEDAMNKINVFLSNPNLNEQAKKSGNYRRSTYQFALDYKKNHLTENYDFKLQKLGPEINTDELEYFPTLTIDGKTMIFSRTINDDEDFFESNLINGKWSIAKLAEGKLNTNLNEGAETISQDGDWLIFTGCNYPEGLGSCDLYISYKTKSGSWTEPENLGGVINTDLWESTPSLSPDKKDLYFSSSRNGGFGGKDIWVSRKNPNGKWGMPQNLGLKINTSADETCPFIHADNQTLYFNSNGLMGYGMADIFITKKDSSNKWGIAENLGYPINTINDEGSLFVTADGITSYYASDRGSLKSGLDIYTFKLRNDIAASKTTWIKGKVYDKKTNAGLPCSVELEDISKTNTLNKIQTDEDGNFLITLPIGKDYNFSVRRKDYLFYSDRFLLKNENNDTSFQLNIPLEPIEKGATLVLKNIFFDNNKSSLKSGSEIELDKLVQLMSDNMNLKVEIDGHTDNIGKKEDNITLSLNRANAVVNYITSKGINKSRLTAKGYGDMRPIESNDTEEGKSHNRRTEINVISN